MARKKYHLHTLSGKKMVNTSSTPRHLSGVFIWNSCLNPVPWNVTLKQISAPLCVTDTFFKFKANLEEQSGYPFKNRWRFGNWNIYAKSENDYWNLIISFQNGSYSYIFNQRTFQLFFPCSDFILAWIASEFEKIFFHKQLKLSRGGFGLQLIFKKELI